MVGDTEGQPRRRLTRAEAKARTRDQILDAAARVFAEKGYAGASVEEIAESAGFSTGALYSNFDSKQELFLQLMLAWRSRATERQAEQATRFVDDDNEDPLVLLAQRLARVTDRSTEAAALQAEFWLYAVRNPEAMQILAQTTAARIDALIPLVTHVMQRYGGNPGIAPEEVTRIALGMFAGLARQRRIDPGAVSADLITQGLRWLLIGMSTASPD
jgi:AcrR family transcriptional regulator